MRYVWPTLLTCVLACSFFAYSPSLAQTAWSKHGPPVLNPGPPDSWDSHGAAIVSIMKDEGMYKAWYVGIDDHDIGRIGYATSIDGITWDKDTDHNPVLDVGDPGEWDEFNVDHASVLKIASEYQMWYNGEDDSSSRIGRATSPDGINWNRDFDHNPVLDLGPPGSWDDSEVLHPNVLFDGATYHMWYNGFGLSAQRTGYAFSDDGIAWFKHPDNPVMDIGDPGDFDDYMLVLCAVIWRNGKYRMWYGGGDGTNEDNWYFRVGYATSPNETDWIKSEDNPVLDVGGPGNWDSLGVVTSAVLFDSEEQIYKMWYGGLNESEVQTGYATSVPATGVDDETEEPAQTSAITLDFPNPFRPDAKISYSLPAKAEVRISIANVLGQRVAVLVDEEKAEGVYNTSWDGKSSSGRVVESGVYLIRVESGEYVGSSKLLLTR